MNGKPENRSVRASVFRNWVSLSGVVVAAASLFAFFLLLILDFFAGQENPYLGILTYLVSPFFFLAGLLLIAIGWIMQRRRIGRKIPGAEPARFVIDFTRPRDRKVLFIFLAGSAVFLLVTSVGSYETYRYTKSVEFCGKACHDVMNPQFVAYQHTPHARVECTECHIGPGADRFFKAKFNGLHQVYAASVGKYEKPLRLSGLIPIDQQTCEQCHWPQRYVGNLDRTYTHFLDDETNTPYSVRMLLKVGGGDPTHGPVSGIHWHMNINNKVEYIATDELRQKIPWVRLTNADGVVTEFRDPEFDEDISKYQIHRMDCMDCHNRPAHHFRAPNDAVDLAMDLGHISTNSPNVKRTAVLALTKEYQTHVEGLEKIEADLREKYAGAPDLESTIDAVQQIYARYFFPEMKTDWRAYPNNIGHKDWPGCFRCHDDNHVSADGTRTLTGQDCNSCHLILGEARATEVTALTAKGQPFQHPEEGWDALACYDCHNGSMEE